MPQLVLRGVLLTVSLIVVAALPGATSAASAPALPRLPPPTAPLPVPIALADPVPAAIRPWEPPRSYFDRAQVVSLYGADGVAALGALGDGTPEQAADRVQRLAREYDALNGERGAIGALHLIVDVAQPLPGDSGDYLERGDLAVVERYVELARERGLLLFLDLQIGWSDPLADVRRLRDVLREPFVHIALDPEFATGPRLGVPGVALGRLEAVQVNAVQQYLAQFVRDYGLPPKILVLHQFLASMLPDTEQWQRIDEVEITIDMDGYGAPYPKLVGYDLFADSDYAERAALKLFYDWDVPLLSARDVLAIGRPPDYIIYQ